MQVQPVNNTKYVSFKAGKTHVFSDFDRTFLPSSQHDFTKNFDKKYVDTLKKYFSNFKEFLEQTKEGLKFTITTGRTFGEFLTMAEISRNRGYAMPLPDSLIVKNGSDEHIRTGTDENFYNGGNFPFKYEVTNKDKEEKIKKASGWDGITVQQILKKVFESHHLRIVEADSEHGAGSYGTRSLFSENKLPYEVGQIYFGSDKADWSVGLRKDGNLKTFIAYPIDMEQVQERQEALADIRTEIKSALEQNGIAYVTGKNGPSEKNGRHCDSYTPNISALGYNDTLNKDFDTREAVKSAIKNNDLVIVAGDGINDLEMLNPISYLKDNAPQTLIDKYKSDIFYNSETLIQALDSDKDLADFFLKIPFTGIIVKQEDNSTDLQILEPFTNGRYKKIIVVNQGELQNGIQEAIKLYSAQNSEYKSELSSDVYAQLDEFSQSAHKKPSGDSGDDENPPDNDKKGLWGYLIGIAVLITAIKIYLTKHKKHKTENRVQINDTSNLPSK